VIARLPRNVVSNLRAEYCLQTCIATIDSSVPVKIRFPRDTLGARADWPKVLSGTCKVIMIVISIVTRFQPEE
jgi:hypothetical protein